MTEAIQLTLCPSAEMPQVSLYSSSRLRDGNLDTGTGMIFYPRVAPVSDPNQNGYETDIFFHPWITRWVPDTLLTL
jgi:hypothetical protein